MAKREEFTVNNTSEEISLLEQNATESIHHSNPHKNKHIANKICREMIVELVEKIGENSIDSHKVERNKIIHAQYHSFDYMSEISLAQLGLPTSFGCTRRVNTVKSENRIYEHKDDTKSSAARQRDPPDSNTDEISWVICHGMIKELIERIGKNQINSHEGETNGNIHAQIHSLDYISEDSLAQLGLPTSFGLTRRMTTVKSESRIYEHEYDTKASAAPQKDPPNSNTVEITLAQLGLPSSFGFGRRTRIIPTLKDEEKPRIPEKRTRRCEQAPSHNYSKGDIREPTLSNLGLPTSFGYRRHNLTRRIQCEISSGHKAPKIENMSLQRNGPKDYNPQESALEDRGLPLSFGSKRKVDTAVPPPPILSGQRVWIDKTEETKDSHAQKKRKRSSTPVYSDCSPLSIASNKRSPRIDRKAKLHEYLYDNDNHSHKERNKDKKFSSISNPDKLIDRKKNEHYDIQKEPHRDKNDDMRPALQRSKYNGRMRHPGSQRLGNHTKHNSVNEVYHNEFNGRRPFNRTFPNSKDDKHLNTKIKRSCLPSDGLNNCSIIECQPDDWSSTFKNKKIQSDVEKQNDLESQKAIRNRLAILAGGYLDGDGNKNQNYTQAMNEVKANDKNCPEVIVLDDDEDNEVIDINSDSSNQCQNMEDSKNDSANEESNRLKNLLQSSIPDDEKEIFLKKHGIRIKTTNEAKRHGKEDNDFWLIDRVAALDKARNCDNHKSSECDDIIILD